MVSAANAQTVITTTQPTTRTVVREPLKLTPAQRTTIYRTVIPQGGGKKPIVKERIVTETTGSAPVRERVVRETVGRSAPAVRERVIVEPAAREQVVVEPRERVVVEPRAPLAVEPTLRERVIVDQWGRERVVAAAPTEVNYVVGDRVPASVQLSPFPERIVREVPATSGYRYMVINDRLLLVDPVTSTVVQEIVR
jgi:hypothetical protein